MQRDKEYKKIIHPIRNPHIFSYSYTNVLLTNILSYSYKYTPKRAWDEMHRQEAYVISLSRRQETHPERRHQALYQYRALLPQYDDP